MALSFSPCVLWRLKRNFASCAVLVTLPHYPSTSVQNYSGAEFSLVHCQTRQVQSHQYPCCMLVINNCEFGGVRHWAWSHNKVFPCATDCTRLPVKDIMQFKCIVYHFVHIIFSYCTQN